MQALPSVTLVIPAYRSHRTLRHCLETMTAQDYPALEIVVVDSSPDGLSGDAVRAFAPRVRYLHSDRRLPPHAARNLGAAGSRGELLVFSDPDIYAPPGWITALVEAHRRLGGVIVGAIACHGNAWLDRGLHFGKFDLFLPSRYAHPVDIAATANMLCARADFERAGGFEGEEMLGDTLLSWKFASLGVPITLVPAAVVEHHHVQGWKDFLRERHARGSDFARLWMRRNQWPRARVAIQVLVTILPLRLAHLCLRGLRSAQRAGQVVDFLWTSPVSCSGQAAWLAGELGAYLNA